MTARRLAVLAQLAAVAACGGPKISRKDAGGVIQGDQTFKSSKYVYLPRTVAIPADGIGLSAATREGEALTIIQIASVDPVVAVLRARGEVTIEDFVSAVPGSIVIPPPADEDTTSKKDSTAANDSAATKDTSRFETTRRNDSARAAQLAKPKKLDSYTSPLPVPPFAQQWVHTLRMTPHPRIMTADLGPDDGEDSDAPRNYGANNVSRTPGWMLAVGGREFVRVLEVGDYARGLGAAKADAVVDFLWRWKSTKIGTPFDVESAEFQSLPREVQQSALSGAVTIDTSVLHWSRATLVREPTGWHVLSIDWAYGDNKPHDRW